MNHTTRAQRINKRHDAIWERSLKLKRQAERMAFADHIYASSERLGLPIADDDYEGDPFECDECGGKIYRNCVDFDGVCDLCKLEEKAQMQLLNLNETNNQKV